jgi:hypothetical protein
MQLARHPHRCAQPPIILLAAPPTPVQLEDVFEQALHGFHCIAPLLGEPLVLAPFQSLAHPLTRWAFVRPLAGGRQQQHPPLPLQLEKQIFVIGFAVHTHRRAQAFQLPGLQPHPLGFVAAVAHPLDRPQQPVLTRHQTERAMPVHPAGTLAVAPGPIGIQSAQALRDNPLFLLLTMPDRPRACTIILSVLTTLSQVLWWKYLLHVSCPASRDKADFFNRSRNWLAEIGGACTSFPHSSCQ